MLSKTLTPRQIFVLQHVIDNVGNDGWFYPPLRHELKPQMAALARKGLLIRGSHGTIDRPIISYKISSGAKLRLKRALRPPDAPVEIDQEVKDRIAKTGWFRANVFDGLNQASYAEAVVRAKEKVR